MSRFLPNAKRSLDSLRVPPNGGWDTAHRPGFVVRKALSEVRGPQQIGSSDPGATVPQRQFLLSSCVDCCYICSPPRIKPIEKPGSLNGEGIFWRAFRSTLSGATGSHTGLH